MAAPCAGLNARVCVWVRRTAVAVGMREGHLEYVPVYVV